MKLNKSHFALRQLNNMFVYLFQNITLLYYQLWLIGDIIKLHINVYTYLCILVVYVL